MALRFRAKKAVCQRFDLGAQHFDRVCIFWNRRSALIIAKRGFCRIFRMTWRDGCTVDRLLRMLFLVPYHQQSTLIVLNECLWKLRHLPRAPDGAPLFIHTAYVFLEFVEETLGLRKDGIVFRFRKFAKQRRLFLV